MSQASFHSTLAILLTFKHIFALIQLHLILLNTTVDVSLLNYQ